MKNIVKDFLNQIKKDKRRRRNSYTAMLVLSMLVASGVLWQLKITGITMTGEALCGYLQHQHTAQCLQMRDACGLEETEGHTHTDACKTTSKVQICQKEEHTHEQGVCYELDVADCGKEVHQHTDSCYEIRTDVVCGEEESQGHKHTDECKREVYVCGYEKEHIHTLMCYSDIHADLETSADWEKTIQALSFEPAKDLAMVARSQIGYAESQRNYKVAEDGITKRGYTRYGEWYGNPYGDWNAMFVSFCLRYAQHPAYETLKNSGADSMRVAAVNAGVYQAASGAVPYVGDLAFLDKDSNGSCDTVAIVSGRQSGSMTLVEGDCGAVVAENQYSLSNGTVLGYALLTAQPRTADALLDGETTGAPAGGEDAQLTNGDNITITFKINNSDYTHDPGSGYTHVKVDLTDKNNPAADGYFVGEGGLNYEYWTGYTHRITGTGILMTRSISAGTTLAGSGYGLPNISSTNITDNNTYSYVLSHSWVTEEGRICNDKTVFTEDTTLYLSLYSNEEHYNLNWVCNCTSEGGGGHSVYFNLTSLYPSPTLKAGQSLSANYILSAADVNRTYTGTDSCNVGSSHNKVFTGWFLKDSSGNEVPFSAGVPITADYADTGHTVKIYARWEDYREPVMVTATFVNGNTTTTETLNSGDPLERKLPTVTAPDGKVFVGWQIGDTESYADAETVIETDTIYTAVFADKVTVTFVNGGVTVETRELAKDSALGTLPAAPEAAGTQVFLGWKADDAADYASETTTISADVTFQAVFAESVTVTLMNGEEEFRVLNNIPKGAKLWDYLPEETPPYTQTADTPMTFAGWSWKDGESDKPVDRETTAQPNMVLYAVFEKVTSHAIYLHDMAPDGVTDYETGGENVLVPVGTTLAQALEQHPIRLRHDNMPVTGCIWYIKQMVDGQETFVPYTLDQKVTGDLHLYTFHYAVTLTVEEETSRTSFLEGLFPVASAVQVSQNGNTLTLTLREGERPTAADFVVNGVDYSLYTWKFENETLSISNIIANGVTKTITATADASSLALTTSTKTINFYVFVDGNPVKIETGSYPVYTGQNSPKYYLSAAQLETIYRAYGFTADQLDSANDRFFPHTHAGSSTVYADTSNAQLITDSWFSPILNKDDTRDCDVYYLPGYTEDVGYTSALKNNYSFYSVTVADPGNLIYSNAADIPAVQYVFKGQSTSVTLPQPAEDSATSWVCNSEPLTAGKLNSDGTVTYTFDSVTEPIVISAYREGTYGITYNINLQGTPASTAPTVNGLDKYTDLYEAEKQDSYLVLTPSKLQYTTEGQAALNTYKFEGWTVIKDDETMVLEAGTVLTKDQIVAYAQYGQVTLTAKWTQMRSNNSVSFYVNLACEVIDYSGASGTHIQTGNANYTDPLYGTSLTVDPGVTTYPSTGYSDTNWVGEGGRVVIGDTDTADTDKKIRELAQGPIKAYFGVENEYVERKFTLGSFPDDELMLNQIRKIQTTYIENYEKWKPSGTDRNGDGKIDAADYRKDGGKIIAIDGVVVPVENINASHYTIRWVAFKYEDNGWHIDGTLVKKQGLMTITKTFYGVTEAIKAVKKNYCIDVMGIKEADGYQEPLYTLTLESKTEQTNDPNTPQTEQGYTHYDPATDTYTWVITLTADWEAYVHEKNYTYSRTENGKTVYTLSDNVTEIATLAEYTASGFTNPSMNTNGRVTYSDNGVEVAAKAHSLDGDYRTFETVAFNNSYLPKNAVPISKVDDYGNPLTGVTFQLYKDDAVMPVWKLDNSDVYYIYDPSSTENVETKFENGYITVDSQGYAIVMGLKDAAYAGDFQFKLVESVTPEGYATIAPVNFHVDKETGAITLTGTGNTAVTLPGGNTMRITNTSKTMDITVNKVWEDSTNKEVTVQLMYGGNAVAGKNPLTLNAGNNWTGTWEDVPVYVGGTLAEYTVKETSIGGIYYSKEADASDGYADYLVSVGNLQYGETSHGIPKAASITVTNKAVLGGLTFKKVDENKQGLAGATFQLYSDQNCEVPYGSAKTSGNKGYVDFGSLVPGTYYMKETQAPAGYILDTTVYQITVAGGKTVITNLTTKDQVSEIANTPSAASLTVKKVSGSLKGPALSGASFQLRKNVDGVWNNQTIGKTNTPSVDAQGMLVLENLMPGEYKLVEYQAPAGYYRLTEEISFTVAAGKITPANTSGENWSFNADGNTVTVVNVAGSELPHTGGMGTHFGTMAGLLMMAFSLLYGFLYRRKREGGTV